ncbi:MAG TPA: SRPBCC family protein [Solirubrobacterales bacterium]|jgi:uncharacterized protein YndB with AHSA1/START domain
MARNSTHINASPERVFEVLTDPDAYGYWVVGSKEIRGADPDWPQPGSQFHHSVGFGPFTVKDSTRVELYEPPRRLRLRAKARPLGTARVTMELRPADGGTDVTMIEDPADPLTAFVFNPLTHLLVRGRNVESLNRLKELAEDGGQRAG